MTSLKDKLSRTRLTIKERLGELFQSGKERDKILDDLAEALILADVGIATTEKVVQSIREKTKKDDTFAAVEKTLKDELFRILDLSPARLAVDSLPAVIMFVGVNGGGKTTSLAKLAHYFLAEGKRVMMVSADTFRAAAQEQLSLWGKKLSIPVIKGRYGADPASVVFDALQSVKARGCDILLVDTAGRIHTNTNLMNELEKVKRVISRELPGAPQEILLVLDSSIGRNALAQAKEFLKFSGITGIFLTKLDGTARGGSVLSIADELRLPIKLVGVGESEKDMLEFSPHEFVNALLS